MELQKMRALSILILILAAQPVLSDEIIMKCDGTLYLFKKSFFSTKVQIRQDGNWRNFCEGKPEKLTLGDRGAKCKIEGGVKYKVYQFGEMMDVISVEQDIILDFIKLERVNRTYDDVRKVKCKK